MKVGGNTGFKTSLTFWQMKSRSASRPCPNAQRFRTLFDPIDDRDLQKKISSALDDIRQSLSDKNTNFFVDDSTENFLGGREDFWGDGTGLLVAYVPKEKLLIQADTFIPRPGVPPLPAPSPFTTNLVENVERLKLDVQRVAHIHGGVNCWSEILKAAGR